jgi:hypothetical protein
MKWCPLLPGAYVLIFHAANVLFVAASAGKLRSIRTPNTSPQTTEKPLLWSLLLLLTSHRYQFVCMLSSDAHGEELWLHETFFKVVEQRDGKAALSAQSLLRGFTGERCF